MVSRRFLMAHQIESMNQGGYRTRPDCQYLLRRGLVSPERPPG
jgi:hypothetical protein